jgi:hypothetical protein
MRETRLSVSGPGRTSPHDRRDPASPSPPPGRAVTREAYAHDAVLTLDSGGDENAPGGAITVALCGSWSHEPPCPLAPHHTRAHRSGSEVTLRVLFAAEPDDEPRVRTLLQDVLGRGWGDTPDGGRTTWLLVEEGPSPVSFEEEAHAERLARS